MSIREFLQTKVPFLSSLNESQLDYVSGQIEELKFKAGQTILFKGASVDGLHIVAQGKVSVHAKPDKNKGWVTLAELGVGEIFGETSIIEYKMAGATIKAAADDTLIYVIYQAAFLKILKEDEALKSKMVEVIRSRQAERHKDDGPKAEEPKAREESPQDPPSGAGEQAPPA